MNTTLNKTTEARSPRGSCLISITVEPRGGLFAVSDVRCQATGGKRSPVNMDSYLYVSVPSRGDSSSEHVWLLLFTRHLTIFPLFLCVKVCYVITLLLTFVVVVMTMSHNAWWPAPCERLLWPTLRWCGVNTKRRKREYANWFGAAQNHPGVKVTRYVGLISFFCFCWLLSTATAVVCRRQCSYITLVITGIALSKPSCP